MYLLIFVFKMLPDARHFCRHTECCSSDRCYLHKYHFRFFTTTILASLLNWKYLLKNLECFAWPFVANSGFCGRCIFVVMVTCVWHPIIQVRLKNGMISTFATMAFAPVVLECTKGPTSKRTGDKEIQWYVCVVIVSKKLSYASCSYVHHIVEPQNVNKNKTKGWLCVFFLGF